MPATCRFTIYCSIQGAIPCQEPRCKPQKRYISVSSELAFKQPPTLNRQDHDHDDDACTASYGYGVEQDDDEDDGADDDHEASCVN